MGRAVFTHELDDPDFSWLLSKFKEEHPEYILIDSAALPITMLAPPVTTGLIGGDPILLLPDNINDNHTKENER